MKRIGGFFLFVVVALCVVALSSPKTSAATNQSVSATSSSFIAITSDDRFVWVANPDNDSVSVIDVAGDANVLAAEVPVGDEPHCVAITPDDSKVYVTNTVSGTVSVINAASRQVVGNIRVGTEPFGCALTPNGTKLYVANFSSEDVSVINTVTDRVIKTIGNVGPKPRGIAISAGNPGLGKATVYVTQFLAQLRNDSRSVEEKEGRDDGKESRVTVISAASDKVVGAVVLNPLTNTGFTSNGSTLDRIAGTAGVPVPVLTGAFPNLLQSIVIRGNRAYLPNTASSPNGPFRFNVNVQSFLSVFDTDTNQDSGQTLNMNRGVNFEPPGVRLFPTNPIAIAFERGSNEGWVVSAASNRILRVEVDASGTPTIHAPTGAGDPGSVLRVEVGKNPQGIVLNSTDTRAYVMNFISRDVSVVDIGSSTPSEIARITTADPPPPGLEAAVHRGKELFNTSIGPAGTNANALPPAGRMSDFGWGSCYSCHPNGLHEGVTWMFPDGPRQAISMESTFAHPQPPEAQFSADFAPILPLAHQRFLNWSAVRDEVQDFELNIRAVSGGQGLITDGQSVVNLIPPPPSSFRSSDLDKIAAYIAFGIRAPISPLRGADVSQGRTLFASAGCTSCHGGVNWTKSRVDYAPPPDASRVEAGQIKSALEIVGTFNANAFNEIKAQAAVQTSFPVANGVLGFNPPSLLSVFAGAPYLHSGSARTLEEVLANVVHRSAGTGGVDALTSAADRAALIRFLKSIDAATPPFP